MTLIKEKKYFSELLKEANDSDNPAASLKAAAAEDKRIIAILGYAANPSFRISTQMPEGAPPFKESDLPLGLAQHDVLHLHNKLYILFRPELKQSKKEEHFIRWLEGMHPIDASIMIAIKDQNIHSIYPKITHSVIADALGWNREALEAMRKKQELQERPQ